MMERALAKVHWAVRNDNVESLKRLLAEADDAAALIDCADYDKRTPLHVAASNNSCEAAELLLRAGAARDPLDRWRNTPLADAQELGFTPMVKLLRRHGARDVGTHRRRRRYLTSSPPKSSVDWRIADPGDIDLRRSTLIGKGSFGEIRQTTWRATTVAVKTIRPSLSQDREVVKDFRNEVALLVKLRHPNIVQFLAAAITSPPLMLITEYLPGGDLHALIQKGPLRPDLATAFALDVARGMAYLHGGPDVVIHRDLKPRNLIIDGSNKLKVGDFGLSKLVRVASLHDVYKLTGETGSYRYMAPEVFLRESYNAKVDVFSFAMICYEMFEGVKPFAEENAYEAADRAARENRRPLFGSKTSYPDGIKELITQCWSEFAVKRPEFHEIIPTLESILERTSTRGRYCFRNLFQKIQFSYAVAAFDSWRAHKMGFRCVLWFDENLITVETVAAPDEVAEPHEERQQQVRPQWSSKVLSNIFHPKLVGKNPPESVQIDLGCYCYTFDEVAVSRDFSRRADTSHNIFQQTFC